MCLLNLLFNLNNFVSGNKGNENQPSNTTQAAIVTETLLYFKHFYGEISSREKGADRLYSPY